MSGFGMTLGHYIRRAFAYRWVVLVPTVVVFALVTAYATILPDVYESSALLMSPISRPQDPAARAEAEAQGRELVRSAIERLMTNGMLQRIAEECDPYPQLRAQRGVEAVIEKLRRSLRIDVNQGSSTITVAFSHSEGERPDETSANVVNCLVDHFIQDQRDEQADTLQAARESLKNKIKVYQEELQRSEAALNEFRVTNQGCLPEDVASNREEIRTIEGRIEDLIRRSESAAFEMARIDRENMVLRQQLESAADSPPSTTDVIAATQRYLDELERRLVEYTVKYSKDRQEVKDLEAQIALVKERLAQLKVEGKDSKATERAIKMVEYMLAENSKRLEYHVNDRKTIDSSIKSLRDQVEAIRDRIARASKIEGEYLSKQRTMTEAETRYREAQLRLNGAELRDALAAAGPMVPIQIEQRAFTPARPAGPDRLATSLIGLAVGLGLGVGLAVARRKVDLSYHRAEDLRALLPGAVLITVPEVTGGSARVSRTMLGVAGGLLLTGIFLLTVAILGVQLQWWGKPEMIQALFNLR